MRIALLVAAFALALVPAAPAGNGGQKKEEKEALRLFEASPVTVLVSQRAVPVEEVAMIAAEAEGIEPSTATARVGGTDSAFAASAVNCSWAEWQTARGIFPYRRWIVGQTYWCYEYGGAITYRASNTAARVDGVCSGSNARDWKVSGGAGYSWVVVHHEASFSCATPWWYPLNDTLWMEPAFNSYGNTSMTRRS